MIRLRDQLRERQSMIRPRDVHVDRRPFHAFVRLAIRRILPRVPRILGQILTAMCAEGVEGGADVVIGGVGDEERPLFRIAAAPDDGVMTLHAERARHRARLNDGGETYFVVHPIDNDVQERCGEKHRAHCMARRGGRPRPPAARQRGFAAQADEGVRLSYGSLRPCGDAAPDRAQP